MLKIGILGAAGIAPAAVIAPASRRSDTEILAVASRSGDSATAYAERFGIERAYEGYEALLADKDITLVYNALPPSEHAKWSIAALEAGKNVLCEKPFALTASQARTMVEAASANGVRIIEAFHDYYHPLSGDARDLVVRRELGGLQHIEAEFFAAIPFDPASLRHDPKLGGGALMDLGCYPVHWVRTIVGEEPVVVDAQAELNELGADMEITAHLRFPSGTTAMISAGMGLAEGQRNSLRLIGSAGTATYTNVVFPTGGHTIHTEVQGISTDRTVAGLATYDHQLEAVIEGLSSGHPLPTEGRDSIDNLSVIEAIYRTAGTTR